MSGGRKDESQPIEDMNKILYQYGMCALWNDISKEFEDKLRFVILKDLPNHFTRHDIGRL